MSYSVLLSVTVDPDGVKPAIGIQSQAIYANTRPEVGNTDLELARKANEIFDKVRIFAEGLR